MSRVSPVVDRMAPTTHPLNVRHVTLRCASSPSSAWSTMGLELSVPCNIWRIGPADDNEAVSIRSLAYVNCEHFSARPPRGMYSKRLCGCSRTWLCWVLENEWNACTYPISSWTVQGNEARCLHRCSKETGPRYPRGPWQGLFPPCFAGFGCLLFAVWVYFPNDIIGWKKKEREGNEVRLRLFDHFLESEESYIQHIAHKVINACRQDKEN